MHRTIEKMDFKNTDDLNEIELIEELNLLEESDPIALDGQSDLPTMEELCIFLTEYGSELLGCGSTCIRLENNVKRMAQAFGMEAEVYIMPRHLQTSVWQPGHSNTSTAMQAIAKVGISFDINTMLSRLSWDLADRKIDFAEARRRFAKIINGGSQNQLLLIILVALANASFCRLFGGDAVAMGLVGVATGIGYFTKIRLLKLHLDLRITVVICAFLSTLICSCGVLCDWGSAPQIAVATSVLYLVPGIPFINSFSDLLYRHYICAFGRFLDAAVLTICLSIGLLAGMGIMHIPLF